MRVNNKGFSLLEIMAVLAITTIIMVPLLIGTTDAYNANQRAVHRSNAATVAESALRATEKIDFDVYRGHLTTANNNFDYVVEFNLDNCSTYFSATDEAICDQIFALEINNSQYDSDSFKIFIIDFRQTSDSMNVLTGPSSTLPQALQDELSNDPEIQNNLVPDIDTGNVGTLVRIYIWIDYFENPNLELVLGGLLADE